MSRIVVAAIGSLGDLHPHLAIALELQKRGHDVVLATHREYRDTVEGLGIEFFRMRPDNPALNDPQEMARMMDLKTGTEYVIRQWIGASLPETYADLKHCATNADFIVASDGVIAARLVAEKLDLRWALSVLQPASFMSAYDLPIVPVFPLLAKLGRMSTLTSKGIIRLSKLIAHSWAEPVRTLRRKLGLPALAGNPFLDDKYSPYLVLALFSSVFAEPQPDWAANTVLTGFTFYDGSDGDVALSSELDHFLAAGDPPIVFTLGSAAVATPGDFYRESLEAARRLNRRAVLLMGKNPPLHDSSGTIFVANYAPYSQLFPRACAIVHQGGIGTTAQALRSGRPTLVMPYSHDQPDNAARVERLGTSRTVSRQHYSAARVARQLSDLLDTPSYASKAAEIGTRLASENGTAVACDAIERQLR